jgi:hypothetical protein
MAPQVSGDLTPKIIDFELGRKAALEKGFSEDEQRRATPVQRIRMPGRLPDDRLELLLTMRMFFAFLLSLCVGLAGLSQF